jgi:hypothetical protein
MYAVSWGAESGHDDIDNEYFAPAIRKAHLPQLW